MWIDDLPPNTSWTNLWSNYIRCGPCSGIRTLNGLCPACGADLSEDQGETIELEDGRQLTVLPAYMGAETRYEDYIYLQLLEREWERMKGDPAPKERMPFADQVSKGASLVLLF